MLNMFFPQDLALSLLRIYKTKIYETTPVCQKICKRIFIAAIPVTAQK